MYMNTTRPLLFNCSVVSDSIPTSLTITHQAPLSRGFSRQEYCSGLPFPSPGYLPNPGIKLVSSALAGKFNHQHHLGSLCWTVQYQGFKSNLIRIFGGESQGLVFLKVPRWFFNQQPGSRITRFLGCFFLLLLLFVTQMKGTLRDRGRDSHSARAKRRGSVEQLGV